VDRLDINDWKDYVPDSVGEQVKVHHCKLGTGNDKLYIKRVPNGAIAYCHHCGERGYASNRILATKTNAGSNYSARVSGIYERTSSFNGSPVFSEGKSSSNGDKSQSIVLPADAIRRLKLWPNQDAKIWVLKHGLRMADIDASGMCWSDSFSGVLFPRFLNGTLVSYQVRKFPSASPKYKSYGNTSGVYDALRVSERSHERTRLVLVEDMLSALKVSRIASAFALGGTSLKDEQLAHLLKDYDRFVVMLDNDNWQVKINQVKLYKRLSMFSTSDVKVLELNKDPKEHSDEELRELLHDY